MTKKMRKKLKMEKQIEEEMRRAMPCSLDDLRTVLNDETNKMIYDLNKILITLIKMTMILYIYNLKLNQFFYL